MAELIPPRRDEPLVDANGVSTIRTAEYLEALSRASNESSEEIDIGDASQEQFTSGLDAAIKSTIDRRYALLVG